MSQEFTAGQRLGDYEILEVLGAGGMGKVYKVRNTISDRIEAMKILLPNLSSQQELADRFLREIKLLASLNHPNIAQLRTALTIDNQLVMIMEFVEGVTLASRILEGPLPAAAAVNYTDQVLGALSYAHKMNIVHRDVKPANMMLTPQGVVKLMDFGIARSASDRGLTMTGTTLGSLNYMPPEQVKGEPADARSDLYSLGIALYEMATGRLPFQGDSSYSLMAAHLNEQPRPPIEYRADIPETLNQIILISLEKDPAKRFQSADAFRNALKNVPGAARIATQPAAPAITPTPRLQPSQTTVFESPVPGSGGSATALFTGSSTDNSATLLPDSTPASAPRPGTSPTAPLFAPSASSPKIPEAPNSTVPLVSQVASKSHRGLYVALGGLLVVGCLAAAAFVVPRHIRTRADADKAAIPSAPQQATPPAQATPTPGPDNVSVSSSGVSVSSTNPDGSKSQVSVSPSGVQVTNVPPPTPGDVPAVPMPAAVPSPSGSHHPHPPTSAVSHPQSQMNPSSNASAQA